MLRNTIILIFLIFFGSIGADAIDEIISKINDAVTEDSATIFDVQEKIEEDISVLKGVFHSDTTKVGIALVNAYWLAIAKYSAKGNKYDSLIHYYKNEQKKILDILLSTKDSNNIEVIRAFFKAGVDTTTETRYKLAKRSLNLKGVNTHDTGLYITVICDKKDELKKECENRNKKFKNMEVNDDIIFIYSKCGKCLENYISDEEVLKYFLRAQELGSEFKYLEEPYDFSEDINRVKEKIKAKQNNKTGN